MRYNLRRPPQHCFILRSTIFAVLYVFVIIAKISSSSAFVRSAASSQAKRSISIHNQRINGVRPRLLSIIAPERYKVSRISNFAERFSFAHWSSMDAIDASQSEKGENVDLNVTQEGTCFDESHPASAQPLYITIGPPCSGKTTWIKRQSSKLSSDIIDVCIDDQLGVYYALPVAWLLPNSNESDDASLNHTLGFKPLTKETLLFGKTAQERIAEQTELNLVVSRLANAISAKEFQSSLESCILPFHAKALVEVVEDIIRNADTHNQTIALPNTIDLFVQEAIFRQSNALSSDEGEGVSYSALERMDLLLNDQNKVPLSSPMALGNTNTRAREYSKALAMAEKTNRPVYFAVFYDDEMRILPQVHSRGDSSISQDSKWKDLFDLFVDSSYNGLIRRNIDRFLRTGRYIPTNVIWDMRDRTIELVNSAFELPGDSVSESSSTMKLRFHQRLAQLAGFEMNDDRLVSHQSSKRKLSSLDDPDSGRRATDFMSHRRPWDRPASAVRGYNGRFPSNLNSNAMHGYGGRYPSIYPVSSTRGYSGRYPDFAARGYNDRRRAPSFSRGRFW